MTCELCNEECRDTCSGPVSSLHNNVSLVCVTYYRHLVTVLVDVRTFLFPLPTTLSLVFQSVHWVFILMTLTSVSLVTVCVCHKLDVVVLVIV